MDATIILCLHDLLRLYSAFSDFPNFGSNSIYLHILQIITNYASCQGSFCLQKKKIRLFRLLWIHQINIKARNDLSVVVTKVTLESTT